MTLRARLTAVPAALAAVAAVLAPGLVHPAVAGSADGTITTLAGTVPGFVNGPPDIARLRTPQDTAPGAAAGQYQGTLIADTGNNAIRLFNTFNTIVTVAGDPSLLPTDPLGDGGDATNARLDRPAAVVAASDGGFLIADTGNDRVRRVTPLGTIFTIAGSSPGLAGDGGPASQAKLDAPQALTRTPSGGVIITDTDNSRVRVTTDTGQLPAPKLQQSIGVVPLGGPTTVQPTGAPAPIALREPDLAPNGSAVNAARSTVQVTLQASTAGDQSQMKFAEGAFRIRQNAGTRPITDVVLSEPISCPAARAHRSAAGPVATAAATRRSRRVWGRGKGRFRTRGRYASALVRGTWWLTQDRCDGTLVKVREGRVEVRDLVRKRTVFVTAGKQYLAKKPAPRKRSKRR